MHRARAQLAQTLQRICSSEAAAMSSSASVQSASTGVQHSLVAGKPEVGQLSQVYQRYALQRFGTASRSTQSPAGETAPSALGKLPK